MKYGAIDFQGNNIIIDNSNFTKSLNSSQFVMEAAVHISTASAVFVSNSSFYFNNAGAISIESSPSIIIKSSTFNSNALFYNGSSEFGGAAINIFQNSTVNITGCNFINNTVTNGSKTVGNGGALFILGGSLSLSQSNFISNEAKVGNDIYFSQAGSQLFLDSCNYTNLGRL